MKIKELIKELKKYKNQNALVILTIGNEDNDTFSSSEFELFNQDGDNCQEYIEIFMDENATQQV